MAKNSLAFELFCRSCQIITTTGYVSTCPKCGSKDIDLIQLYDDEEEDFKARSRKAQKRRTPDE